MEKLLERQWCQPALVVITVNIKPRELKLKYHHTIRVGFIKDKLL